LLVPTECLARVVIAEVDSIVGAASFQDVRHPTIVLRRR